MEAGELKLARIATTARRKSFEGHQIDRALTGGAVIG